MKIGKNIGRVICASWRRWKGGGFDHKWPTSPLPPCCYEPIHIVRWIRHPYGLSRSWRTWVMDTSMYLHGVIVVVPAVERCGIYADESCRWVAPCHVMLLRPASLMRYVKARTQQRKWTEVNWIDMHSFWRADQWASGAIPLTIGWRVRKCSHV